MLKKNLCDLCYFCIIKINQTFISITFFHHTSLKPNQRNHILPEESPHPKHATAPLVALWFVVLCNIPPHKCEVCAITTRPSRFSLHGRIYMLIFANIEMDYYGCCVVAQAKRLLRLAAVSCSFFFFLRVYTLFLPSFHHTSNPEFTYAGSSAAAGIVLPCGHNSCECWVVFGGLDFNFDFAYNLFFGWFFRIIIKR